MLACDCLFFFCFFENDSKHMKDVIRSATTFKLLIQVRMLDVMLCSRIGNHYIAYLDL